jgi:hypothetical protein
VLYANPGYTMWIDGMDRVESDTILDYLFRHQERADFLHGFATLIRQNDPERGIESGIVAKIDGVFEFDHFLVNHPLQEVQ